MKRRIAGCAVCGQPLSEHTADELATGCKRQACTVWPIVGLCPHTDDDWWWGPECSAACTPSTHVPVTKVDQP